MKKYKFTIRKDKLIIKGYCYKPDEPGKIPAIIISHEFGSNMLSTSRYARKLCPLGYAVFIFDFCGSGSGKSTGRKSTDMSVITEKEDLSAVLDYVKGIPYVDKNHIVLGGSSQGGLVTALLAAERKDEIEKIFLYYPALSIPDDARRGSMLGSRIDLTNIPERFTVMHYVKLGKRYVEDVLDLEPWKEICTFDKPVLICHGTADRIVNITYARKAAEKYPKCRLVEIADAKHMFLLKGVKEAIIETTEFLKK